MECVVRPHGRHRYHGREKRRETHAQGGDPSRTHDKPHPSVQKAGRVPVCCADVEILSAGMRQHGAAAEDPRDRRVRELEQKVGELEGVIGQKTLELDFFAGALRRIKETRRTRGSSGERASTQKSASGCDRKAD